MSSLVGIACFMVLLVISAVVFGSQVDDEMWAEFKEMYNKTYANANEENQARANLEKNLADAKEHNSNKNNTYTKGVWEYSDMDPESAKNMLATAMPPDTQVSNVTVNTISVRDNGDDMPTSINWTAKGAVTSVKNQGSCGVCTIFSITGAIEGRIAVQFGTNKLVNVSQQQEVDCNKDWHNCLGESNEGNYDLLRDMGGIQSDDCYPYEAKVGDCKFDKKKCIVAKVTSYVRIGGEPTGNETATAEALVKNGPLAIAVKVVNSFMSYKGGVYKDDNCLVNPANHALLLVGFGIDKDSKQPYWLLKNSWGTSWGENGYMRILKGQNMCLVARDVTYPILALPDPGTTGH